MTTLTHLECGLCGRVFDLSEPHLLCPCGGPLLARYDLERARRSWSREWVRNGPSTMWRYAPVLPVRRPGAVVSLGEGMTPLVRAARLGERLGAADLWIKDEGANPTGSVKARAMACAVSMALEQGVRKVGAASMGNAGAALAACAASAGVQAHLFLPRSAPPQVQLQCRACGGRVRLVEGGLAECRRALEEDREAEGRRDLTPLREPYGLEGAKTLGYELAEQFNWEPPEAILLPVGEGMNLIGVWKAFQELEALGWIAGRCPRLVAVRVEGCSAVAAELAVPRPLAEALSSKAIASSGGMVATAGEAELLETGLETARLEGVLPSPEGAACVAALRRLLAEGALDPGRRIVLCNPASGWKRWELYAARLGREPSGEADKLGGLITPR
jgi:threonine synthase